MLVLIGTVVGLAVGLALGAAVGSKILLRRRFAARVAEAEQVAADAQRAAEALRREAQVEAREEALRLRADVDAELGDRRAEVIKTEERITSKEREIDAKTSERTVRLGLSDSNEAWLLPRLLRLLAEEAPRMRLITIPVQFRTIAEALNSSTVDLAVTVADELPADTRRLTLFTGGFVCLFDPRHAQPGKRLTLERYLAHEHVIVSYNGDLRGIVEDLLGVQRRVRVSVPTFHNIGALVEGTALLATVPDVVARELISLRPNLRTCPLPLALGGSPMELLWRSMVEDDEAIRLIRDLVIRVVKTVESSRA